LLEQNYRSTANILNAANAVIKNNSLRKEKNLWTDKLGGEKCSFVLTGSETEEAVYVAELVEKLRARHSLNDFAVFYRINAQSRVFEDVFNKRQIPYRLIGGVRFYARREVKDILAYLRLIVNPQDSVSLQRIINVPPRGIGDKTIVKYVQLAAQTGAGLFETLGTETEDLNKRAVQATLTFKKLIQELQNLDLPLPEFIEAVIHKSGYHELLSASTDESDFERLENVLELVSIAREYTSAESSGRQALAEFLEQLSLMTDADNTKTESGDAVTLMTIHSAKGLEFPVVFLTGLEENVLPHLRSLIETTQLEEERRLCYVAITRAQEQLFLSAARIRSQAGETHYNEISRFVAEIPAELLDKKETAAHLFYPRASRPAAAAANTIQNYAVDDTVLHDTFGEGRVLKVFGQGADQALEIQFARARKSLLVKYAKMSKL
jgi:DNA helicase-2/ATP-dependent DNA helicase PcrA